MNISLLYIILVLSILTFDRIAKVEYGHFLYMQ